MIKAKKKNAQFPLIVTGYILFALLVVGVLISTTIPFGMMLFSPKVLHYNVALFTIALTVGAILPAVVGYIIGDQAVKSKNKTSHHFNGVLFGLLAYWVMSILTVLVSIPSEYFSTEPGARVLLVNTLPSISVAIVTTVLALMHVRSRQAKRDLIDYKPFSITLIIAIILVPVYSLISRLWNVGFYWGSLTPFAVILFFGVVSYVTLRKSKLTTLSKLTWSAISVSIAYVLVYVSYQLVPTIAQLFDSRPTMEAQAVTGAITWALAMAAWVVYWVIQRKALLR